MSKKNVMISIDENVHKRAKEMLLNISSICESALRSKDLKKSSLPEDCLIIKCSNCSKEIEEGYLCEEAKKVYCLDCQDVCNLFKKDNHMHQAFPNNLKALEVVKDLEKKANSANKQDKDKD